MNDSNWLALSSIAMDLRRVALGYHRGSKNMAERFLEEAIKRKKEVDISKIKPYLKKILDDIDNLKTKRDKEIVAEDALLYSILLQNASLVNVT